MKIFPPRFNQGYLIKRTSFESTRRTEYYDFNKKASEGEGWPTYVLETYNPYHYNIKNSNYTNFFRHDIDRSPFSDTWRDFAFGLFDYFPKDEKINIYDFASSDGSEAYSLIIALIEALGEEEAKRFLPIKAFDIDSEMVKKANSGIIEALDDDISKINFYTNNNLEKYFEIVEEKDRKHILKAKPILSKNVTFENAKIQDKVDILTKPNSAIFARNMWKYMSSDDREETLNKMYEVMDDSSRIFLGHFDFVRGGRHLSEFASAGFITSNAPGYSLEKSKSKPSWRH